MKRFATPWYGRSEHGDDLEQGDFFEDVPHLTTQHPLPRNIKVVPIFTLSSVVVLSQSCDLVNSNKLKFVQVAQVGTLKEFLEKNTHLKTEERLEALRKNNIPRYHLLNKNPSKIFSKQGYLVVDFGAVFSISVKTLKDLCKEQPEHLTLLSPYKEKLSQEFARFYMRVGLPDDISPLGENWLR